MSSPSSAASSSRVLRRGHRGALREADGVVPDRVTVFDDKIPTVANLDPGLLQGSAGCNGCRGREGQVLRQQRLAVSGIPESASSQGGLQVRVRRPGRPKGGVPRHVFPHVPGDAADLGHSDAMVWLSKPGAKYGLCQIYRNEPWHYGLRPEAIDHGCPRMCADPTQDPRMQQ